MPESLDPAVQRRFERSFLIGIPNLYDRIKILQIILKDCRLSKTFDFEYLATLTEGYSPSDLLALSKAAVQTARRTSLSSRTENSPLSPKNLPSDNANSTYRSSFNRSNVEEHKKSSKNEKFELHISVIYNFRIRLLY